MLVVQLGRKRNVHFFGGDHVYSSLGHFLAN
jgi:hypothetical protein